MCILQKKTISIYIYSLTELGLFSSHFQTSKAHATRLCNGTTPTSVPLLRPTSELLRWRPLSPLRLYLQPQSRRFSFLISRDLVFLRKPKFMIWNRVFRSLVLDLVGPSFEQVTAIFEVFRSLALVLCFSPLFLLDSFSFSIFSWFWIWFVCARNTRL